MQVNKSICVSLILATLSIFPIMAHAKLTITNNTNQDSTSILNNGICSSSLSGGVTKAHSTNVISNIIIALACLGHESNCKADVYMTNNCSGNKIATVLFDVKKGIKSVTMDAPNDYQITHDDFTIQLDGGPTLASKL